MIINIQATGIELTNALRLYAEEKISGLTKFFDNIMQADIDIGMLSHHHQKGEIYYAEVNLHVPNKIVRVVKESDDLYKAIDKVKDHLKLELDELKQRMREHHRDAVRNNKEYQG